MKRVHLSVAVALVLIFVPVSVFSQKIAENSGVRTANAGEGCREAQTSQNEQDQVVQMLDCGPKGVEFAVETLKNSSDARLREVAAYIIGEFGNQQLAGVLAGSVNDRSEQVRRAALTALQKIVNPEALRLGPSGDSLVLPPPQSLPPNDGELCSALQPLFKDRSPLVRAPAAETDGWLRCSSSVPGLQDLLHDPIEYVRFRASHALKLLTGATPNFINLDDVVWGRPPLMTVGKALDKSAAQQAGPFLRTAFFEKQGKFSYRGGIPAQYQTVLRVWWTDEQLKFEAECQDEQAGNDGGDKLTFFLRPQGQSTLYQFEVRPSQGLVKRAVVNTEGREEKAELHARASTGRNGHGWRALLEVPFRDFGLHRPPAEETWEANIVRAESHHAAGWGPEFSSWTYFDRDAPGWPRLGSLHFAENAPALGFRPSLDNVYVFPFDQDSLPADQIRPIRPEEEIAWADIISPDHLIKGVNTLFISHKPWRTIQTPLLLTLKVYDYATRKVITSPTQPLALQGQAAAQKVAVILPGTIESRAVDLEVTVSAGDTRHEVFRTRFICVPVVSPPRVASAYHLPVVEDEKFLWNANSNVSGKWVMRDYGPMLMTESYPMPLIEDGNGKLYGGTYPGGRLFSFRPATGELEDLGSPSPPANHLSTLVLSPGNRLYGGLYRPRGRIFSFEPSTRTSVDLGVPVPGAFSGECKLMAWASGRVYGTQRGHLFFCDSAAGRIVDKGSFLLNGKRYLPLEIASDAEGNLLGTAGGRLFRYVPASDELRISDVELSGWLLRGPRGKLYTLFLDGRLFMWKPDKDELVQVARYAPIKLGAGALYELYRFRGILLALASTGELIEAESGIDDPLHTAIQVYRPDGSPPLNLGNPVPGSFYLTSLTVASDGKIYGMSVKTVYGLDRTPVHIYALTLQEGPGK